MKESIPSPRVTAILRPEVEYPTELLLLAFELGRELAEAERERDEWKERDTQLAAQHGRLCDLVYEEDGETLKQDTLRASLTFKSEQIDRIVVEEAAATKAATKRAKQAEARALEEGRWKLINFERAKTAEAALAELADDKDCLFLMQRLATAEVALAAAQRDAERYRWLRQQHEDRPYAVFAWDDDCAIGNEALDAAIDAARSAKEAT